MSTSLRDQLLKAGLVSKQQVNEAERQRQRQERKPPQRQTQRQSAPAAPVAPAPGHTAAAAAQGAKMARDQALNRRRQEQAEKKALAAQIKQMIEQNRLPACASDQFFNFVDGGKVRRIAVDPAVRGQLIRGEIVIVHHDGRYDLVAATVAARIRERDAKVCIAAGAAAQPADPAAAADAAYAQFAVPDDLMW